MVPRLKLSEIPMKQPRVIFRKISELYYTENKELNQYLGTQSNIDKNKEKCYYLSEAPRGQDNLRKRMRRPFGTLGQRVEEKR